MNQDKTENTWSRTELDPDRDVYEIGAWVPPMKCGGCGGRINSFYRTDRVTEAQCIECGSEWKIGK